MRNWINILKVVIGVGLFGGLIWFIDPVKVWGNVKEIGQFRFLLFGALFFLFGLVPVQVMKFHFLLRSGRPDARFKDSLRIVMIGFLFNNFLPTNVGGDVVKSYLFKRSAPMSWGRIVGLITLERVVGMLILLLYGILFLFFRGPAFYEKMHAMEWQVGGAGVWVLYFLSGLVLLLLITWLLIPRKLRTFYGKVRTLIGDSRRGILELGRTKALGLFLFSTLFHLCRVAGYFFFLMALGEPALFQDLAFAVVFTSFVSLIPISVGALGVKEGGLALALSLFGVPFDIGITVGVLNRGMLFLVSLIGLALYFSSDERYVLKEGVQKEAHEERPNELQ